MDVATSQLLTGEVLERLLDLAARHDGLHGVHPDVLLQLLPERAQQHQILRLHHHASMQVKVNNQSRHAYACMHAEEEIEKNQSARWMEINLRYMHAWMMHIYI